MMSTTKSNRFRRAGRTADQRRESRLNRRRRLRLETLEDRRLLATIVVDSPLDVSADDGVTTLREAVNLANVFIWLR